MKIYKEIKNNLIIDSFLIILCALPYWVIANPGAINFRLLIILISYFLIIALIWYIFSKLNLKNVFFSLIIFYGFDSKIGLWIFFSSAFDNSFLRYFFSFIFLILFTIFLNKVVSKNFDKFRKVAIFILSLIFISNSLLNFWFNYKYKSIENFGETKDLKIESKIYNKEKTIILILDELVGYNGIDENIKLGLKAKDAYLKLFQKHNFTLHSSAYTIYKKTHQSLPSLLNFNYQTNYYNLDDLVKKNDLDKFTNRKLLKNKYFEKNNGKSISSNKNQALNYCDNYVKECFRSEAINNFNNYIPSFDFDELDYFILKMKNENSILVNYIWRSVYALKYFDHYHFLTFNKVKFKNDLKNLAKYINQSNSDIFLFHFLFPHRPFVFDLNENTKVCDFNKKNLSIDRGSDQKLILNQHYKEIICTTKYLDEFLKNILSSNKNLKIIILSDSGFVNSNIKDPNYLRDNYSVLFAVNFPRKDFNIQNTKKSSQELFHYYVNDDSAKMNDKLEPKVFRSSKNAYVKYDLN